MCDFKAWDGRPEHPDESGWHWIEDADGLRPLLWRGDDWPERVDRGEWQDGYAVLSARDLSRGCYHGPVAMTPRLEAVFRRRRLLPALYPTVRFGLPACAGRRSDSLPDRR